MEETLYKVKTTQFEGPLEVLLHLIEKRKLFINEISLAEITDDYIRFIESLSSKGVGHYADFIAVAATLILIKSRSLLPNMELTEAEEAQVDDLEARLRMYKVIQDVGKEIEERYGKQVIFARLPKKIETRVFSPDTQTTQENLRTLVGNVLALIPEPPHKKLQEVSVVKVKSLKEMIEDVTDRITKSLERMNFKDLWKGSSFETKKEEKVTVIVSFLAVLELVRQGIMHAFQDDDGEINLEKQQAEHPLEENHDTN